MKALDQGSGVKLKAEEPDEWLGLKLPQHSKTSWEANTHKRGRTATGGKMRPPQNLLPIEDDRLSRPPLPVGLNRLHDHGKGFLGGKNVINDDGFVLKGLVVLEEAAKHGEPMRGKVVDSGSPRGTAITL